MTRFRRHASAVSTELDNEVVALQLDTKKYYTLNESAMVIWRGLSEPATEDDLVDAITREFAIEPVAARPEVTALLQQLVDWRLAEPCE
jgi:hypothetical protein